MSWSRIRPVLLAALVTVFAAEACAADLTDIWWIPAESGQGYNIVQSGTSGQFLFVTFFIYGPDNQPTWYTAQLQLDSSGFWNGGLYRTRGTYYAIPWNPADHPPAEWVGNASFQLTGPNTYQGTLTYALSGSAPIVKQIERQPLTATSLAGTYTGGSIRQAA